MFMSLIDDGPITALVNEAEKAWTVAHAPGNAGDTVVLHDQARLLLTKAVCAWAGIPLAEDEAAARTVSSQP